jgi:hypothetical protein
LLEGSTRGDGKTVTSLEGVSSGGGERWRVAGVLADLRQVRTGLICKAASGSYTVSPDIRLDHEKPLLVPSAGPTKATGPPILISENVVLCKIVM